MTTRALKIPQLQSMESQYSADAVAAAMSVQFSSDVENNPASSTFRLSQYIYMDVFASVALDQVNFTPDENPDKCLMLDNVCSSFFVLRTYALWNNNRIVLAALLTAFLAVGIAVCRSFLWLKWNRTIRDQPGPGYYGLLPALGRHRVLCTICPSYLRLNWTWRTANTHLFTVLLKHNIFYYACGLFCSVVNILTSLLLEHAYNAMFQDFQFIILTILATHMHLHLWHMDRHLHGSDAPTFIPLSEISYGVAKSSSTGSTECGAVTGSGS
ncbi:hypothetical protein EDD22DRAFT_854164 [Suillus occidentalis]|nr:hypothetical protein EDD22DRAFT_854164 [Suillus occidentalis]